jgi:hypothetical protein
VEIVRTFRTRKFFIKIHDSKDFYAGLLFIFFGVFLLVKALDYPMGAARKMGPGYFPIVVGGLLAIVGVVITLQGLLVKGEAIKVRSLRPLLAVSGALFSFAFLIRSIGLIMAVVILVCFSCLGKPEFRLHQVLILSLVVAAMVVFMFVFGLGLPIRLFW